MQTPAEFEYERPLSIEKAIAALQAGGPNARVIAGGHSLLPMMKLRLANPTHLVDINEIADLSFIRVVEGELRIGALTRHVELLKSGIVHQHFPLFRDAEQVIADPVVRNRGTIGGSLCQADAADLPSPVRSIARRSSTAMRMSRSNAASSPAAFSASAFTAQTSESSG